MNQREITSKPFRNDALPALLLGLLSASVVVWQNVRITVLWDLAYILENATRIAAGDVPYRDFPFPYAPLTFVMQALLIRLFGHALWHHVAWAALAGGAATAITYLIVRRLTGSRATAALLSSILIPLGIYCIFPHPFYDPDCCLIILSALLLMLRNDDSFALGVISVVPLFVKQNIGLAFIAAMLLVMLLRRRWRTVTGIVIGSMSALLIVAAVFGLDNYIHWTIRFASARRLPPLARQLEPYMDPTLWWWLACVLAGFVIARRVHRLAGLALMTVPWLWVAWRFFVWDDPLEPQINLLRTWPLLIVLSLLLIRNPIALVIFATIQGTFLSQSTWGSTYGIWPLLVILLALAMNAIRVDRASLALAALVVFAILLGGTRYILLEERLKYAKVFEDWRPDFQELVDWTDRNIPRNDAILSLPGEDIFYFTTARRPRVPVLMFDTTNNPYDAGEIAAFPVRWVIVKKRLQLNGEPMQMEAETMRLLAPRLTPVAHLHDYDIYLRQ